MFTLAVFWQKCQWFLTTILSCIQLPWSPWVETIQVVSSQPRRPRQVRWHNHRIYIHKTSWRHPYTLTKMYVTMLCDYMPHLCNPRLLCDTNRIMSFSVVLPMESMAIRGGIIIGFTFTRHLEGIHIHWQKCMWTCYVMTCFAYAAPTCFVILGWCDTNRIISVSDVLPM